MLDYVIGTFGSIDLEHSIGSIQHRDQNLNSNFKLELSRKKKRTEKVDLERAGESKQVARKKPLIWLTLHNYGDLCFRLHSGTQLLGI